MNDNTKGYNDLQRAGITLVRPFTNSDVEATMPQAIVDRSMQEIPSTPVYDDLGPNVEVWQGVTSHSLPVNRCIQQAFDAGLEEICIVGTFKDGGEFYMFSESDAPTNMFLMARAMHDLNKSMDKMIEEGDPRGKSA